jgi:hypothetical protein
MATNISCIACATYYGRLGFDSRLRDQLCRLKIFHHFSQYL